MSKLCSYQTFILGKQMSIESLKFFRHALFLTIFILGLNPLSHAIDINQEFKRINEEFQTGRISKAQKLVGQMDLLFDRSQKFSTDKSESTSMLKSGTPLIREVFDNWDLFSNDEKSLLTGYLARPSLEATYDSPGGYFKIHFDTALNSAEMVPREDKDGNLIPDYVDRIALYCDSSYRGLVLEMGYLPPPVDASGGDSRYDIYLMSFPAYGVTYPESPGDSAWNDYTSFIGIHNDFYGFAPNEDPEGDTIGAQKATCAHEYFHAVQLAYDLSEGLWWMEATATWMEEVLFPEVNDNYNYLPYFFNYPEIGLQNISEGYHLYGAFVWPAFLHQKYGLAIIKDIWNACRYNTAISAIDSGLAPHSTKLLELFPEFTLWNYYTGSRAVPGQYYESAADYPMMPVDRWLPEITNDSIYPLKPPDGLGCNYIKLTVGQEETGHSEILLDGDNLVRWGLVAIYAGGSIDSSHILISDGSQDILLYQSVVEDFDYLIAIPSIITPYLEGVDYRFDSDVISHGDANFDRSTNLGDAIYLINRVFRGGPAPQPIWQTGDANCDGTVNIGDAVTLINYIFHGGTELCGGSR